MTKERNKLAASLFMSLLLLSAIPFAAGQEGEGSGAAQAAGQLMLPAATGTDVYEFLTEDYAEFPRIIAYMYLMETFVRGVIQDVKENMKLYLTTNPHTLDSDFGRAIGFFRDNVLIAYIFAIVGTGLYMVLSSASPKSRAEGKYMIGRMLLGLLIVALSPYILHIFFSLSSLTTSAIIDEGGIEEGLVPYENTLMTTVYASQAVVYPQIFTEWFGVHKGLHGVLHGMHQYSGRPWFETLEKFKMAPKPDFTFPFLMIQMFFVLLLYGLLGWRYIMMMTWALLFPVSIFLSTFEPTKGLGRAMLEQTIFWTILQAFYALSLVVIGAGMQILPAGFDYFKLGLDIYIIDLTLSFFWIGACIVFLLTPIFVLSMLQRLMSI